jgi:hypothetical protein
MMEQGTGKIPPAQNPKHATGNQTISLLRVLGVFAVNPLFSVVNHPIAAETRNLCIPPASKA